MRNVPHIFAYIENHNPHDDVVDGSQFLEKKLEALAEEVIRLREENEKLRAENRDYETGWKEPSQGFTKDHRVTPIQPVPIPKPASMHPFTLWRMDTKT